MALSPQLLTILVIAALLLAAFSLLILFTSLPRGGRRLADSKQAVGLLSEHDQTLSSLKVALRQMAEDQRRLVEESSAAVQRVGLVRYDAFEDMGGHLSFSAALLDGDGNGFVITSINGRQDTRCYAKPVRSWTSSHNLSEEEDEAIRRALAAPSEARPTVPLQRGPGRPARRGA